MQLHLSLANANVIAGVYHEDDRLFQREVLPPGGPTRRSTTQLENGEADLAVEDRLHVEA